MDKHCIRRPDKILITFGYRTFRRSPADKLRSFIVNRVGICKDGVEGLKREDKAERHCRHAEFGGIFFHHFSPVLNVHELSSETTPPDIKRSVKMPALTTFINHPVIDNEMAEL